MYMYSSSWKHLDPGFVLQIKHNKSLDHTINLQALQESGCLKGNANPLSIAATYILGGST